MDKIQTAKDSGLVLTLVTVLANTYFDNQRGNDQIATDLIKAENSVRVETNVMNTLNNQADEDVNLQGGINRVEEDLDELQKKFNEFIISYYRNGGGDPFYEWSD